MQFHEHRARSAQVCASRGGPIVSAVILGALAWAVSSAALAQPVAPARAGQTAEFFFSKLNLNDTGRTTCISPTTGLRVKCAGSGQDGEFGRDVSNPKKRDGRAGFSFVKLAADGTELSPKATDWSCVKDKVTGLVWEVKTADGGLRDKDNTYTDYRDGRPGDASAFVQAVNATGLCGYTDWDLPSPWELQSLVDYGQVMPSLPIDTDWFPNTVGEFYRTWAGVYGFPPGRWSVRFGDAGAWLGGVIDNSYGRDDLLRVRLVRGGRLAQGERFVFSADEVTDRMTGLVWRRCSEGQTWDAVTCTGTATRFTWQGALDQAHAAAAGGTGWRLPNVKELFSLIDFAGVNPSTDPLAFPNTPGDWAWTSTFSLFPDLPWGVSFEVGHVNHVPRGGPFPVRLVRDGG